ncbi:ferritin-like domain-containing protein [Maribacter hydrothermalis]|nr:PA2169 family four-helix-bundle protein [Maribacter hydrothermalis]
MMNKDIKKIEDKLKDVVEKNEDSVKGFEKAADLAKELSTKSYFDKKAKQRRSFIKQLRNATPALQLGNGEIDGSTKGAIHRSWMDVKTLFSGDNDETMLSEAVRGDKAAISEYNEVMTEVLIPNRMKEILREQKEIIQNDLETSMILENFR